MTRGRTRRGSSNGSRPQARDDDRQVGHADSGTGSLSSGGAFLTQCANRDTA